jgi:hypothetical protein
MGCEYLCWCCAATTAGRRVAGVHSGLFAYNETPTIAVAIDCWFWARQQLTRPFLCLTIALGGRVVLLGRAVFFDEPHPQFFDHRAH